MLAASETLATRRFEVVPSFERSYWAIDYSEGFVRRGLGGELLRTVVDRPSAAVATGAALVISAVAFASLVILVELLLRRGALALALLVASSPFTFAYVVGVRPDLLSIPILVLAGFGLRQPDGRRLLVLALAGVLLAMAVLIHEGSLLVAAPWLLFLPLVVHEPGGSRLADRQVVAAWAVSLVPSVIAAACILAFGSASDETAHLLDDRGAAIHGGVERTVLTYLPDSIGDSLHGVIDAPRPLLGLSVLAGLLVLGAHVFWVRRWCDLDGLPRRRGSSTRRLRCIATASLMISAVALFATGFDWYRWFGGLGSGWLVLLSFVTLGRPSSGGHGVVVQRSLLVLGALLVAMPMRYTINLQFLTSPRAVPPMVVTFVLAAAAAGLAGRQPRDRTGVQA